MTETLKTDVLVIGGGAAGLRAALEAATRGFQVLVLNKGPVGRTGITPMASDGISAAINPDDSVEVHYQESLRVSRGIGDRPLLRALADESVPRVKDLIEYSAKFRLEEDGRLFHPTRSGKRDNHTCYIMGGGVGLMNALKRGLKSHPNIKVMEDTMALRLVKEDDRVAGAVVLDIASGKLITISAGAVILATGGYEELWHFTDTSADSTGEGLVLALEAGADLVDLEMVLFHPFIVIHPPSANCCFVPYDILNSIGGKTLDGQMRDLGTEIQPPDLFNRTAYTAIQGGSSTPHGGFYFKIHSNKSESEIKSLLAARMGVRFTHLQKVGIELQRDLVEMAPGAHYCLGGVRIDEHCSSRLPGLSATGEISGNVHGAERLFSNALSETQVFGTRAGRSVSPKPSRSDFTTALASVEQEIREFSSGAESPGKVRAQLKQIMWRMAGPTRRSDLLLGALQEIARLSKEPLRAQPGAYCQQLMMAFETKAMIRLARAVVLSALTRTESRGHHYREDHPRMEDEWLGHTRIRQVEGEMTVDKIPVV